MRAWHEHTPTSLQAFTRPRLSTANGPAVSTTNDDQLCTAPSALLMHCPQPSTQRAPSKEIVGLQVEATIPAEVGSEWNTRRQQVPARSSLDRVGHARPYWRSSEGRRASNNDNIALCHLFPSLSVAPTSNHGCWIMITSRCRSLRTIMDHDNASMYFLVGKLIWHDFVDLEGLGISD